MPLDPQHWKEGLSERREWPNVCLPGLAHWMPQKQSWRHEEDKTRPPQFCCQPQLLSHVHVTLGFTPPVCAAYVMGLLPPHAGPLTLWDSLHQHRGLRLSVCLDFSISHSFGRGHSSSLASPWSPAQSGLHKAHEEEDLVSGTLAGTPKDYSHLQLPSWVPRVGAR